MRTEATALGALRRVLAWLVASCLAAACGGEDVTTLSAEQALAEELAPEPGADDSRVFAVLARPESVDAVCRLLGVSAPGAGGAGCASTVESCRESLGGALLGRAAPDLPDAELEALFGCPLTVAQLDGCIAGVLERGVAAYGSAVSCEMPAPPPVDALTLLASPECLLVGLFCPDLVAALAGSQ